MGTSIGLYPRDLPFSIAPVLRRLRSGAKLALQHLFYLIAHPVFRLAFIHHLWMQPQNN